MTALLGDAIPVAQTKPSGGNATKQRSNENDVSSLSVAETAALLKKIDAQKQSSTRLAGARWRAQKSNHIPQHHALVHELEKHFEQNERKDEQKQEDEEEEEEENESFTYLGKQGNQRKKVEPQILLQRKREEPEVFVSHHRRNDSNSSSNSSGEEDEQQPSSSIKRRGDSNSTSEDDYDDRINRLLEKRRQKKIDEHVVAIDVEVEVTKTIEDSLRGNHDIVPKNESSSSDDSESDDIDSDESAMSSSEEEVRVAKPLFVPKHSRNKIASQREKEAATEDQRIKEGLREEKRKTESRMMLAQVVAAASIPNTSQVDVNDETGGSSNDPPDDEDPTDPIERELERDAWEVRELLRLFETNDLLEIQQTEQREYERRKHMSDQARMEEDRVLKEYQKSGELQDQIQNRERNNPKQRYYHRGAFYMDKNEWTADDVRHKSKEYERAATGDDKIDKSKLPEIMQVKGFGLARMGSKYKGLSKEDTTDKGLETLPIVRKKGPNPNH